MIRGLGIWGVIINLAWFDKSESKLPALTESKPTSYYFEFGALYNLFPDPPRTESDVLISFGTPTDKLRYVFNYDNTKDLEFRKQIAADSSLASLVQTLNCKTLFETGTIRIRKYNVKYDAGRAYHYYMADRHYDEVVLPSTESGLEQVPLTRIRTCCTPECTDNNFVTLARGEKSSEVGFFIYREGDRKKYIDGLCIYCALKADISKCKNGFFASDFVKLEQEGSHQRNAIECRDCPPGTWNTCLRSNECIWQVPEPGGYPANGNETAVLRPAPVGTCFACEQARQWPQHYLNTPRAYTLPPNIKAWKCPGRDSAPVACPSDQFTHSDDWSECICDGATYPSPTNSSVCIPCPTGHYCIKGKKYQCRDHYYQANTGQSACLQCASRADINGEYSFCEGNKQLQMCDSRKIETQNQPLVNNCVECSKCKRLYSTVASGQLDCYRSYKAGAG